MGFIFHDFSSPIRLHTFFPFCGKIKESQSQNLNSAIFLLTLKCPICVIKTAGTSCRSQNSFYFTFDLLVWESYNGK